MSGFDAPASWTADWAGVRRALAVRLDAVGDVLMTTPAIRALKESGPGRRLTLLTSPAGAEAARMVPEIDEVVAFQAPWMKSSAPAGSAADEATMAALRGGRHDGAVVFTVFSQSPLPAAYLCHLAGIPRRLAHVRENPYHLVTHRIPEPETDRPLRHEVRRQLDLVEAIGARTEDPRLSLTVPPDASRRAHRYLADVDRERPWAVIHPGASAASRRYPWERYAAVAAALAGRFGWQLVFTGDRSEVELVERIRTAAGVGTGSLAGRLDLPALAAVVEAAPVLITNNTGAAHIAAAVGTPVVDLYALTNDQHTPWMVESRVLFHDVPCRNCLKSVCPEGHHNCLRHVAPDDVVAAAVELARGSPGFGRMPVTVPVTEGLAPPPREGPAAPGAPIALSAGPRPRRP